MSVDGMGPGIIWGIDVTDLGTEPVLNCESRPAGHFRWLHLNLADHGTRRWIERADHLPPTVRDLLLSADTHQRALVDGNSVGCVLHDFERDFDVADTARVGALRIALTPGLMLTTRLHPIRSADIVRHRLSRGMPDIGPNQALELLVGAIGDNIAEISRRLSSDVQQAEDSFLEERNPPKARDLIGIRRRLAQIHRLLSGMRGVFQRLEQDEELPTALLPSVEKLAQRLQELDADIMGGIGAVAIVARRTGHSGNAADQPESLHPVDPHRIDIARDAGHRDFRDEYGRPAAGRWSLWHISRNADRRRSGHRNLYVAAVAGVHAPVDWHHARWIDARSEKVRNTPLF